jgi:phenylalanine-4-hydroxylase
MLAAETVPAGSDPYCRDKGPNGDYTVPQDWSHFSAEDHSTWDRLFTRQSAILTNRVVPEFFDGLGVLRLSKPGVPDFAELSDVLMRRTGWQVVAVPGLIPEEAFFDHLAHRRFPAGNFIRTPAQLDYLQEPDVFHDVFGHVPMLAHPAFADYMQAYGEGGLRSLSFGAIHKLARLYWYTVEFGLIKTGQGLRIYGAGIASSRTESVFALESPSPNRLGFDLMRVMQTLYRIDDFQPTYFVIDSFEDLLRQTVDTDFAPLYAALESLADVASDAVTPTDQVYWNGTQSRADVRSA